MLYTKLHYRETAKTAKTYASLETKMIMDIHKSLNELLPQQSPTMSGESFHREMDNYREGQKVLSHYCNSYWQENNNSVVVSQTTGKHECGLSPYFCLWKSLFVLNMSHSSPSVAQHTTWPWPNVVGFLIGVTRAYFANTHFTLTCCTATFLWAVFAEC